ncbi:MAG: Sec-independent protein translocase protein TatB [Clostridia bacterium]|nr:Sec-independent protein translocase protein TatB [Clostridia bacterium]
MFNIGAAELILLLLIAFVVVGPKDLPKVARALGRFVRYIREMIEEVKKETGFDEVADELKGVERDVKQTIKSADIRPDLQKMQLDINKELKSIEKDVSFKEFKKDFEKDMGGKSS